jgi:hypothetical protein
MDNLHGISGLLLALVTVFGLMFILVFMTYLFSVISKRIHSRLIIEKKIRRVRCELEKVSNERDQDIGSQESASEKKCLVEMEIILTNHGLWIRMSKDQTTITFLDTQRGDLVRLFRDAIIPYTNMRLFRTVSSPKGVVTTELTLDAENGFNTFFLSLLPQDYSSFSILVTEVLSKENIGKLKQLEQPIKLIMTVLDQNNNTDQSATLDLFQELFERKKRNTPKNEYYVDNGSRHIYW